MVAEGAVNGAWNFRVAFAAVWQSMKRFGNLHEAA
jgi:hypothetical protein